MSKILVGALSEEGYRILNLYIEKFMPEAIVDPLRAAGIKGRIKNHAGRSEVVMVIIDDALYQMCVGVCDDVLSLPKVHRYTDDVGLKQFLISKFGKLDADDSSDTAMSENISLPTSNSTSDYRPVVDDDSSSFIVNQEISEDLERKLRVEISTRDSIIENLKNQIKELTEGDEDDDYSAVYKRVSELEEELGSKNKEIAELKSRGNEVTDSLHKAEDALAEVSELKSKIVLEQENSSALKHENSKLEDDLKVAESKISSLELEVERLKIVESDASDLSEVSEKYSNCLRSLSDVTNQKEKLESEIKAKDSQIAELQTSVADRGVLENRVKELTEKYDDASSKIIELTNKYDSANSKVSELTEECNDYNSKITDLETQLSNAKANSDLAVSTSVELESIKSERDSLLKELDSVKSDREVLNNELIALRDEKEKLLGKITELNTKVESNEKDSELVQSVSKELEGIKLERDSLLGKIDTLKSQLELSEKDSEGFIKRNADLESQLTEVKCSVARLESEKATLQLDLNKAKDTSEKDMQMANLRIEITKLQTELKNRAEEAKNSSEDSVKRIKDLELTLTTTRERAAKLELDVHDKDEQLQDLRDNIFLKMGDYALPKITVPLSVPMPFGSYDNMFTFASGSAESCVSTYQMIRKIVSADSDKRFLIVDLVTDTYIDRELGVRNIKSPANWLQGSEPVDSYIADTKFENVKVISTALAYMNDLFLLMVDWKKRLDELKEKADIIILNVGSLDNVIHNTLFNSFSNITRCHVIVKATPINLRTALLHLLGFPQLKNTLISCVNIEEESQQLYQRLASKFPTQLLSGNDILKLEMR